MFEQKIFFDHLKEKFQKSIEAYKGELAAFRTGKATPAILDGVTINYYGQKTPLHQAASVSSPDARLLIVQPWDKTQLKEIESAIRNANLGLNPINDGHFIKVPIPSLTEERRKDIVKQIHQVAEKFRVSQRHIRREAIDEIKKAQKDKEITEDDEKKFSENVEKELKNFMKLLDEISAKKEKEVMEV